MLTVCCVVNIIIIITQLLKTRTSSVLFHKKYKVEYNTS